MNYQTYRQLKRLRREVRALGAKVDELKAALLQGETTMSKEIDDLKAAVAKNNSATDSAITLIKNLMAQVLANKDDPAAIEAIAQEVSAKADSLGAAVTANTPS